jgi:hypothetical protein
VILIEIISEQPGWLLRNNLNLDNLYSLILRGNPCINRDFYGHLSKTEVEEELATCGAWYELAIRFEEIEKKYEGRNDEEHANDIREIKRLVEKIQAVTKGK